MGRSVAASPACTRVPAAPISGADFTQEQIYSGKSTSPALLTAYLSRSAVRASSTNTLVYDYRWQ